MNSAISTAPARRVYHCTYYKCGSQWIRDLLNDPRIVEYSGCALSVSGVEVSSAGWPFLSANSLASPLYTVGDGHWRSRVDAMPTDRAIVVIRDPRDIIVSLVFSINYSHTPDAVNRLLRRPLRNAGRADRIHIGMHMFSHWSSYLRSWAQEFPADVYLIKYENFLKDEVAQFDLILDFLGWKVPYEVVSEVVISHSFQQRSGRPRGVENEFSHRRKGISGDWKNHFTRDVGQLFEQSFPKLLAELGYEKDTDWWHELPEVIDEPQKDWNDERTRLLSVLELHETELKNEREAAQQRLEKLIELTRMHEEVCRSRDFFMKAAEERLAVIDFLAKR